MTPYAKYMFKLAAKRNGKLDKNLIHDLCKASCFDLTPVWPLISRTSTELSQTVDLDTKQYEHGGLLFLPDPMTWIEMKHPSGKYYSAFIFEEEGDLSFRGVCEDHNREDDGYLARMANDRFNIHTEGGNGDRGMTVAIALMLINAPRGVDRQRNEPHKGFEKRVKEYGLGPLMDSHTIRLSSVPGNVGTGGHGGGMPKAFHFCRSHIRRLSSTQLTVVKAHWRGDPSIGICDNPYKVISAKVA